MKTAPGLLTMALVWGVAVSWRSAASRIAQTGLFGGSMVLFGAVQQGGVR